MAYTKEFAIDQVYLLLTGGKPTTQSNVKRGDVEPYLLAACQAVWEDDIKERKLMEMRSKRTNTPFTYTDSDVRTIQTLIIEKDKTRDASYITVPFRMQAYGGQMIWDVLPLQGFDPFYKIQSRMELSGIDDLGIKYAMLESRTSDQRIYLYGGLFDEVILEAPFDFNALQDTDILPIPAGRELAVIQKCVEYFSIQNGNPINLTVNQNQEGKKDA